MDSSPEPVPRQGLRYGEGELPGHAHRRNGVRQLLQTQSTAQFPLSGVIRCWTEGVQRMKVGGKARLVCPSGIAYGENGHPPTIPGGATLIFEIELLEIGGR